MPNIKRRIAVFATNHIFVGTRPWTFPLKRKLLNWGGYDIGENSKVVGPIYIYGQFRCEANCWVGKNLFVNGNGVVEIGNNCDIGPEVIFQTRGHKIGDSQRRAGEGELYQQVIGNGVWIGGRSTFLKSVHVGDGSVIAGCACVLKDVPSNVIVGGVPAHILREL